MELVKEGSTKNKWPIWCNRCYGDFKININDIEKETTYTTWCEFQVGRNSTYWARCPYCNKKIKINRLLIDILENW